MTGPKGNSSNPLKQVLDAVGETVECKQYDRVSAGSTTWPVQAAQPGACVQAMRQAGCGGVPIAGMVG